MAVEKPPVPFPEPKDGSYPYEDIYTQSMRLVNRGFQEGKAKHQNSGGIVVVDGNIVICGLAEQSKSRTISPDGNPGE